MPPGLARHLPLIGKYTLPGLVIGTLAGLALSTGTWTKRLDRQVHQVREERFNATTTLIHPLLDCDPTTDLHLPQFKAFEDTVRSAIASEVKLGNIDQASVYFRSLDQGFWTGINEDTVYDTASLMKLPYLFAYYKQAMTAPGLLDTSLVNDIDQSKLLSQNIRAGSSLQPGKSYTIRYLLHAMIVDSDNDATALLFAHLDKAEIKHVFQDLTIPIKLNEAGQYQLSPKQYSAFFRVLYNASYFDQQASAEMLDLLTQTEFKDGLVAGVPKDTAVAHKFGERTYLDAAGQVESSELHDCGIIYYPEHPFFLCVMTRGKDLEPLKAAIRDITHTVYGRVDEHTHPNRP